MRKRQLEACKIMDCEQAHFARGFCQRHYAQLRKGMIDESGQTLRTALRVPLKFQKSSCKQEDCSAQVRTRGWCNKHYLQFRAGIIDQDGNKLRGRKSHPGRGWVTVQRGYRKIMCKGHPAADQYGYVLEHRLVMEQILDRFLTKDEVVHHKDGVRSNNDPSNLEVHTRKSHPPAHEYTAPLLEQGLEALSHNDPEAFRSLLSKFAQREMNKNGR